MSERRRPSLDGKMWEGVRGSLRFVSSDWQANSLARGATMVLMVISALVVSVAAVHGAFAMFAGTAPFQAEMELVIGAIFGAVMLAMGWANWQLYHKGYELREEPVDTVLLPDKHGQWEDLYPASLDEAGFSREAVLRYADEFFYNALVNPRSVFSRISEYVEPGRKMLDCKVNYEVQPPPKRGIRMLGINDLSVGQARRSVSCFLVVPVSFQKRGDLTIKLQVTNSSGNDLPTVKQAEIVDRIVSLMEGYRFKSGKTLKDSPGWKSSTCYEVKDYLGNMEANEDISAPEDAFSLMRELAGSDNDDRRFVEFMFYMLCGLKEVVPVCVSLHVAALRAPKGEAACADAFPLRVFGLYLKQKCETERKPANVFPNVRKRPAITFLNKLVGKFGRRTDTVYYNLARAGRSTSYHLYVEGPEGTYYARGSLLKENPRDARIIHAEHVEMQRRYGQRHAHIYIRNGHLMSNTTFMFRYKKAPLDTYHIMFVAAFLCLAVLAVSAIASIAPFGSVPGAGESNRLSNLSVPAMILAVATAAGPWIYNRTSDGKGDSLGVEASAVVLTICSAIGILMFFTTAQSVTAIEGLREAGVLAGTVNRTVYLWSILVAVMVINTAFVGYVALLHSSLYRYLVDKSVDECSNFDVAPLGPRAVEVEDGVRLDTPQGRSTKNPYGLWTEALRNCRETHVLEYEKVDER